MIDFKSLGQKLREIRLARGFTQEYISLMTDVNVSHISNIENNKVKVSLQTLVSICNTLNVTVDYVLSKEYITEDSALNNELLKEFNKLNYDLKVKAIDIIQILNK